MYTPNGHQISVTLRPDNKPYKSIHCDIKTIEITCKKILGWKTPTKNYDTIYKRYMDCCSREHDLVIWALQDYAINM